MNLRELQRNWHSLGKIDPFWAILTDPHKKGNKWRPDEFFESGKKEIEALLHYIRSLNLDFARTRALDFGCGIGRLTQALAAYFDEAVGVDIAPSMIKLAKRYNRFGKRCKYYLNETEGLACFNDHGFDFIYSNIVLQHMRPQYSKGYLREMLRVLRPAGILVFQLPSERGSKPWPVESHTPEVQGQSSRSVMRMKQIIKPLVPGRVLNAYYRFRYEEPTMEMYCVKEEDILQLLTESGAKVLDIVQNNASGPNWISCQYCVTKD